jgi:hypothetical protein
LAERRSEDIFQIVKGLPNWLNREGVHLMGWPDEVISHMVFGTPPSDDSMLHAVQGFINRCLEGTGTELVESARQLQERIRNFKERRANNSLPLVELCRNDKGLIDKFARCSGSDLVADRVRLIVLHDSYGSTVY